MEMFDYTKVAIKKH